MRNRRPSPAMGVALIALFVALGGTSFAAINYARNAGAVDGKSATAATSTLSHAAGRLVATEKSGVHKGRIPGKFLAEVPRTTQFARPFDVPDNAAGAAVALASEAGVGTLTAACIDQNKMPGKEDPLTTITYNNGPTTGVNLVRYKGNDNPTVGQLAPNTVSTTTISGSNTFSFEIQTPQAITWLVQGVVRQDGAGTAAATCLVFGTILRIAP